MKQLKVCLFLLQSLWGQTRHRKWPPRFGWWASYGNNLQSVLRKFRKQDETAGNWVQRWYQCMQDYWTNIMMVDEGEREKNETISHNGFNENYEINDETNIIRLRSYTPVKQRNWSILVWFVFSVRFSMLFYSSYHSHCKRRWELSSWRPHNIQRTNLVSKMSRWWYFLSL